MLPKLKATIKYTIKLDDNGNFVIQDGDTHQVHLDNIKTVTTANNTYNSTTEKHIS